MGQGVSFHYEEDEYGVIWDVYRIRASLLCYFWLVMM